MKSSEEIKKINQDLAALRLDFQKKEESLIEALKETNASIYKAKSPAFLESDILQAAQNAISQSINAVLTGYGSPLSKLVEQVIAANSVELKQIIAESFSSVIKKEEFKQSIVNAFSHKVARTIISNNDGLFDKVSNELKQDAVFEAKMSLAVSNVVEECLTKK